MKIHTLHHLPHDVVENYILSRLPVKSLLRFKSVCKQWSATISDPKFAEAHLQQSFLYSDLNQCARRVVLENDDQLHEISPLNFSCPVYELKSKIQTIQCCCDGLYLVLLSYPRADYVVWNPSRGTYKNLHYPFALDSRSYRRTGICYNPPEKDYKVVVVDDEHYAVFSCKNDSWREVRATAISFANRNSSAGVPYNESIYWIRYRTSNEAEIVCFNGKDEELKILRNLDYAHDHGLFASRDGLYVVSSTYTQTGTETMIKKILPELMEHEVKLPLECMKPVGLTRQNKFIFLQFHRGRNSLLYDCDTRRIIHPSFHSVGDNCLRLHPYIVLL